MELPPQEGRLIVTPHPILVDGQQNVVADLRPGESLYAFLSRHVDGLDGEAWVVAIGGKDIPRHLWHHVYPKDGQVIEVRAAVGRTAVAIVATIALAYFTFGAGGLGAGGWITGLGLGAGASTAIATGVFMAGSLLINKVLTPKPPKPPAAPSSVYSLGNPRNRARPYEPLGLLFGTMRIAPDVASNPYTWYEGDDQYLSMILTPGLNVDRVDALYNGDALLSSYEGVQTWFNGFSGMPSQDIPLYSNADVVDGGTLIDTSNDPKGQPGPWVQRASSADTIALMVNLEYQLWDVTSKGKDKENTEQVQIQYRPVGTTSWLTFGNYTLKAKRQGQTRRATYTKQVARGQYDVRVRTAGQNTDGSGATCVFQWTTLVSVQADEASYAGIPRIGIKMKASGQLNGAPDEIRCVAHSKAIPVWDGTNFVVQESSNPGAQILAYARGFTDQNGKRIAGMGLPDERINIDSLKAFTLHCAAHGYTYDNWITDVRSHDDVLKSLALAGMGEISWAGGRLAVVWAAEDQPLSGVVNMATIKQGQFQVDYTLANAADGIEYTYLDRQTWETKTLRVPAPGIQTMLNPAQVTGEGVTSEAHAAVLARWHLAQSLYQYKSIGYSTDLEYLSYGRLSVLALQHDLTQWGFGGRVMAAEISGGVVTLTLDEPVPAPATGNAFIGLRIPGERVYRIFGVQAFSGTSKTIKLVGAWPSDAALPGNSPSNPAWDTIWIYDFKQTPGYRVRVTGIQPENELTGAAVTVVPEGPEFWTYVLTGQYIPPPNGSQLQTRPVASDLKISEIPVIQGDTVFTELQATFEVSGPVGDVRILSDLDGNGELEEVARTSTRSARWRIPGAGTYSITARPYSPDGLAGTAVTVNYTTQSADAGPVLVDLFDVEQLSGGLRRYYWGFLSDTIQSPDFAGVEIRYVAGDVPSPVWDSMQPLGADGYHAVAFESALPPAGTYTFLVRSRNTSGTLSTGARRVVKTLTANLGEVIGGIEQGNEQTKQELLQQIANEAQARTQADAQVAAAAAAALQQEAAAQAAALEQTATDIRGEVAEQVGQLNQDLSALQAEVGDLFGADQWSATTAYSQGALVMADGVIYKAKQNVPAGTPVTNTTYWQALGNYAQLSDQVQAQAASITSLTSRVTSAEGTITSQGQAITQLQQQVAGKADASALTALTSRVSTAEGTITSQGQAITSLTNRIGTAEGNISAQGAAITSLSNRVTSAEGTLTSQGQSITSLTNSLANIGGENMIANSSFESRTADTAIATDWVASTSGGAQAYAYNAGVDGAAAMRITSTLTTAAAYSGCEPATAKRPVCTPGQKYTLSVFAKGTHRIRLYVQYVNAAGAATATHQSATDVALTDSWTRYTLTPPAAAPEGTVAARCIVRLFAVTPGTEGYADLDQAQFQLGTVATAWALSSRDLATSEALSSLTSTVTQQGNTIASQGQAITSLGNRVTAAEGNISANSSAIGSLTSRVSSAEGAISSQGQSITSLQNNLGQTKTYRIISAGNVSSKYGQAGIWNASNTRVVVGGRGLTLAVLQSDGSWASTTYDVYGDAAARQALADALTALTSTQYFVLYGNDSFEYGKTVWSAAAIACGASQAAIDKIGARYGYILIGRGALGAGNGTELVSDAGNNTNAWVERGIQVLGGVILDISGNAGMVQGLLAASSAITSLTSRVAAAEGTITSQGQSITSLANRVTAAEGTISANSAAIGTLTSTVTQQGNAITSQGQSITSLQNDAIALYRGASNLATKGDFEYYSDGTFLSNGASGSAQVQTGTVYADAKALKVTAGASTNGLNFDIHVGDVFTASPTRTYYFEAWVRVDSAGTAPTTTKLRVGLHCITAANSNAWIIGAEVDLASLTPNTWVRVSGYATSPSNAVKGWPWMSVPYSGREAGVIVYVDNFVIRDVTEGYSAQQTASANSSAITGLTSRVAAAEGSITSQGQAITSLRNSISGSGVNILPDKYSVFEATTRPLTPAAAATVTRDTTVTLFGLPTLKITASAVDAYVYFGSSSTDYSRLQITGGKSYIVSAYIYSSVANPSVQLYIREGNSGNLVVLQSGVVSVAANTWVRISAVYTSNAATQSAILRIDNDSGAGTSINVSGIMIEEKKGDGTAPSAYCRGTTGKEMSANSDAITSLTGRVTAAEGTLTSQSNSLTALSNRVTTAESNISGQASAITSLQSTVTQQGNTLSSHTSQITSLSSSVAGKADVSIVQSLETKVDASLTGGGNLLVNSTFKESGDGWLNFANSDGWTFGRAIAGAAWEIPGLVSYGMTNGSAAGVNSGTATVWPLNDIAVVAGQYYIFSSYSNSHRGARYVTLELFDKDNNLVGSPSSPQSSQENGDSGAITLGGVTRQFVKVQIPSNVVRVRPNLRVEKRAGDQGTYAWFWCPMLEQVPADQAGPSPWSAGGAETMARATLALTANGKVAGYSIANTGTVSSFDVVADSFSVSPSNPNGARTEFSNGNWRVYDENGVLRVALGVNI
ncbi:host specificity factor TipJ family phage tail protein [[Pseudomonas] boreopolis]|uniref:Chitin-binding type-3 domain-containing protein n=1 Tax=Xanthomonas boreopolis TaxID=86183 RepID=A0A919F7H5_9XANT|nr:hypothetical protein GCM10009090_16670 [[Pseudomonas] boreopolis]